MSRTTEPGENPPAVTRTRRPGETSVSGLAVFPGFETAPVVVGGCTTTKNVELLVLKPWRIRRVRADPRGDAHRDHADTHPDQHRDRAGGAE